MFTKMSLQKQESYFSPIVTIVIVCTFILTAIIFLQSGFNIREIDVVHIFETKYVLETELASSMKLRLSQYDPELIRLIRNKIQPPSVLPYNNSNDLTSLYPLLVTNLEKFLAKKTEKYFFEVGALDGEYYSHTYHLEREHNWSGFLMEAEPEIYEKLMAKQRNASTLNACLSPHTYPINITFYQNFNNDEARPNVVYVECYPITSVLMALNRTSIDFMKLDVESSKPEIIEQIPFNNFDIRSISISYTFFKGGKDELLRIMSQKGYTQVMDYPVGYDMLFVSNHLIEQYNELVLGFVKEAEYFFDEE